MRFSRGLSGTIIRWTIIAFVVYWVYTAWAMCGDVALDRYSRAIDQRDNWCTVASVTREERARRALQHDCIGAHHAIQEGPFRLTVECFVGEHLEYFGRCSEFAACRAFVDWAETLRALTWYAIIIGVILAAKSLFESIAANGAKLREAVVTTKQYAHAPVLPTTTGMQHIPLPSEVINIGDKLNLRRRDTHDEEDIYS